MMSRSRSMTAVALVASALAFDLVTGPPGFTALSDAELAATRGMSPGYAQKVNADGDPVTRPQTSVM